MYIPRCNRIVRGAGRILGIFWRHVRIALCNEVIAPMPFPKQCEVRGEAWLRRPRDRAVHAVGRAASPRRRAARRCAQRRRGRGRAITGLHWLLIKPSGLSISTRDDAVRTSTVDVMRALIDQCAELGGRYLVHGSPHQRRVDPGDTRAGALARAQESSPRSPSTREGGRRLLHRAAFGRPDAAHQHARGGRDGRGDRQPRVRSMLDCSSAGRMETQPLPRSSTRGCRRDDRARAGQRPQPARPGQGEQRFAPLIAALVRHG
jgi:hypothetical protein